MFEGHVTDLLAAYADGRLGATQVDRVQAHLAECASCRAALSDIQFATDLAKELPLVEAPASVWESIERAIDKPAAASRMGWLTPRFTFAAVTVLIVISAASLWYFTRPALPRWDVARLEGAPTVGSTRLAGAGQIAEGEWLQTDALSRASIQVGGIGVVEVAPNTRVRLTTARPNEHRLMLARGEISATVTAPPRLFFVDTPSSTAVDLGCAYKMHVDDNGNGLLEVTLGWVSLEWGGRVSEVPAGAYCRTRRKIGPGTPYFKDAPERLRLSLERLDFKGGGEAELDSILAESRLRDTLTLWHLLSRVQPEERLRVYERLVSLASLPPGISREKTLALDPETLKRWGDVLVEKWD